jgi:hypothetical protein
MVRADRETYEAEDIHIPPSRHPDRVEQVNLMCAGRDRQMLVYAPITRYPDKPPTLGDWINDQDDPDLGSGPAKIGGRFGDAMNLGLQIAREMPPEMVEIIEEGWETSPEAVQDLIERFVNVSTGFDL